MTGGVLLTDGSTASSRLRFATTSVGNHIAEVVNITLIQRFKTRPVSLSKSSLRYLLFTASPVFHMLLPMPEVLVAKVV